jgi:Mn2+/Fe2+ NRAMP family transporter
VPVLFFTQVANAVLLLPLLVVLTHMGRDRTLLGRHASGRIGHAIALAVLALVAASVVALGLLAALR